MAKKKQAQNNNGKVDNELLQQFTKYIIHSGYLKINTAAHNCTQLINHHDSDDTHSSDLISDLFSEYCNDNSKKANSDTKKVVQSYVWQSLSIVVGIKFNPLCGLIIRDELTNRKFLNKYKRYVPTIDDQGTTPDLFIEYLERLFPVKSERKLVTQWLAHCIQKPAERPSWHLMLSSEAGTGKGFMVEKIMTPLLAYQTMVLRAYTQLLGKFSSCLSDNMLILLDDTKSKSRHTTTELKSILSEERQYIEIKQLQGKMMNCYSRIILASNEIRPILLDEDDRRWLVTQRIVHKESQEETEEFIKLVEAYLSDGGIDEIFWYLTNYDLDDFKHKHVAKTETHRKMVSMSVSVEEQEVISFCEDKSVFNISKLNDHLKDLGLRPSGNRITHYLTSIGYERKAGWRCDGTKGTYYHISTITNHQDATLIYQQETEQAFKFSQSMVRPTDRPLTPNEMF